MGAFRSAMWHSFKGKVQKIEQVAAWAAATSQFSLAGWSSWFVSGANLLRLRAANWLFRFMTELIPKLDAANITWTVENPWTSLLWEASYWVGVDTQLKHHYCELHNFIFGGLRLKRTGLASNNKAIMPASNNKAIMPLNILCSGDHEHEWSVQDGNFDTARGAEYTPTLAKALATTILEAVAEQYKLPNVNQFVKRLKLSHFPSIAAGKQPTKITSMQSVPEFSHVIGLSLSLCLAVLQFSLHDDVAQQCTILQRDTDRFFIPRGSRLLQKTWKKGGEVRLG
eukprot:s3084_g9.t1